MSAQENLNPQQFYHGSNQEFKPGDMLTPAGGKAHADSWDNKDYSPGEYVHTTLDPGTAHLVAGRKNDYEGLGHVYTVEHTGPVEEDKSMNADMQSAGARNFRTKSPVRVTGEDHDWWERQQRGV